MRIVQLTAYQIPVALKKPVRHASHTRHANETLIVRCELQDGSIGWGEGLPRPYVTGETTASVWRHLQHTDFSVLRDARISNPAAAVAVLDALQLADVPADPGLVTRECFGNSVRCAVELAVLDAVCRSAGCSISQLLCSLPEAAAVVAPRQEVFYSGAITSQSPRRQWLSAWKMRLFAFRQVKVKVGAAGIDDVACLRRIRRILGPQVDLRLDANEAWQCDEVVPRMQPLLQFGPSSLEQPVPHSAVAGLAAVRPQLPVPIMLDESLCCVEDGLRAIHGGWCDLFNIRLSKCGGLVRSLRLAVLARQHGLGYQLGCQVGETGILSAAGRHFACSVGGIRCLEGSFDRFLVRERLTTEDLTFRFGGRAAALTGAGLGVTIDERRIQQIQVRTSRLIP